ncbi:MAG: hypothetical protein ACKPKO_46415, partial [Candidatus Fonsibacter sp.]
CCMGGVLSVGPVASSEGCFPKYLTPPAEAQGAPPTFQFVPPSVSPKKMFFFFERKPSSV